MVWFGNLLTLHRLRRRHHHRKWLRYSSWMIGKADCVIHLNSGWTHHFQAMLHLSHLTSFLPPWTTFSFLFSICVSLTFGSAQSTIDVDPIIYLNVRVSSLSVAILFGRGVSLSVLFSSSYGRVLEWSKHKLRQDRQIRHETRYIVNLFGRNVLLFPI
jgi:hypothetical protein